MRFALICTDKAEHIEVRKANRDAHLAYIAASGVVEMAGPFLSPEGVMCGSLLILDVADRAAAEAWAKDGLFAKVRIEEWKKVIG